MSDNLTKDVCKLCGRYSAIFTVDELRELFEIAEPNAAYTPRYNVAPTQPALVVTSASRSRVLSTMKFGFASSARLLINARSETITSKPTFRTLVDTKRCLIPADGFFEWRNVGKVKIPYRFTLPANRKFAFPGIYTEGPAGAGFVIITTDPSSEVAPIHDRMPVMLTTPVEFSTWLDGEASTALELLRPYSSGLLSFELTPWVNSALHDDPQCIIPVNKLW